MELVRTRLDSPSVLEELWRGTGGKTTVTASLSHTPSEKRAEGGSSGSNSGSSGSDGNTDAPEGTTDTKEKLPLDQVFEILKNKRRREVLHYLEANDGNASLSELAEHIAAIENDTTVKAITSTQRKRVYVGLYQCHLPKMDGMDVVDFDKNRGTVRLGANAEHVRSYLGDSEQNAWYKVYLGLAVVGGALLAGSQLAIIPAWFGPSVILSLLLVGVVTLSIAQASGFRPRLPLNT